MALTVDADWFQLRFFITGNQIIISDQFVSPMCSSVMNFPIVTTSALFCDSMIAEIAQIGDVRKIPCREIFSAGDSCLYGPYALILNCFVISAVCIGLHPQCSCPIFFFSIFLNCVMGHSLYYSSVPFPLILWDDLQVPQERYTKNGVAGQQVSAGLYVANRHQYYANCKFSS